jgi:hypothetical protein
MLPYQSWLKPHYEQYIRNERLSLVEIGSDSHFQRDRPLPSTSILSKRDGLKQAGAKKAEWRGYTSQAMFRAKGTPKPSLGIPASFRARPPGRGFPPLNTPTQKRAALANPCPTVRRLDARQSLAAPKIPARASLAGCMVNGDAPTPFRLWFAKFNPLPAEFPAPNSPDDLPDFHPQTALRNWCNGQWQNQRPCQSRAGDTRKSCIKNL